MRQIFFATAIGLSLAGAPMGAYAQQSDTDYIAKVMTAAPASVVKDATVIEMQSGGAMRTLRTGTNQFTCMVLPGGGGTPMCADKNAMEWMHAMVTHAPPPNSIGFVYMLGGDEGASNTDPTATAPTSTNHWVKTGPHVMIVGPAAKTMGYPMTAQPDVTKPYVMWPETPYAHLMIPVSGP